MTTEATPRIVTPYREELAVMEKVADAFDGGMGYVALDSRA